MNTDRLEQLMQFLKEDPKDPFNIYCLANEYKNHQPTKALHYYKELLDDYPQYLPTYYHAAELFINLEDISAAEKILTTGIALASKENDQLALRELRNLKNNLYEF